MWPEKKIKPSQFETHVCDSIACYPCRCNGWNDCRDLFTAELNRRASVKEINKRIDRWTVQPDDMSLAEAISKHLAEGV